MNQQFEELDKVLSSANQILITGQASPNIDTICTAAAWQYFLAKQKKLVDVVFSGHINKFNFLPNDFKIKSQLADINKFKVILDISKTKLKQLSYDIKDNKLEIDIVPDQGNFKSGDLQTRAGDYKYDLIIVLGAVNLEALGDVFTEARQFFYQTPVANIDRSVLNENFGQFNIINSNATSLAEISYLFLNEYIDQHLATCLLAGMLAATNSFQSPRVTPDTLDLASQLIIKGADRVQIVETLYRTKDIDTLKNWGRALSRLRKHNHIITSWLKNDEVDNLPQDFQEMVKELILSSPGVQVAIIFYQLELYKTEVWLYTIDNIDALELSSDLGAQGYRSFVKFTLDRDIEDSRELVNDNIAKKLEIINSGD